MKNVCFSFYFLLGIVVVSLAQNTTIDSLLLLENDSIRDTAQVNLLNQLTWEYHRIDLLKTFEYGNKALKLAESLDYQKGIARALNLLAIGYAFQGQNVESIELNQRGLEIAERIDDSFLISVTTNDLANAFATVGETEKALRHYQKSLELARTSGDILSISFTLGNIGLLHGSLGNTKEALAYLLEAAKIAQKSTDPMVLSSSYSNLGTYYEQQKNYDQALEHFRKAYSIASDAADKWSMAILSHAMAELLETQGKFEIAETQYLKAIQVAEEFGDLTLLSSILLGVADYYLKANRINEGVRAGEKSLQLAQSHNQVDLLSDIFIVLAKLYKETGNYEKAYTFNARHIQLKDSLWTEKHALNIAELDKLYQTEKKENENRLLKAEQARNEALLQRQTSISLAIGIILILVLSLLLAFYRSIQHKKSANKVLSERVTERTTDLRTKKRELENIIKELERFNYVASHDIKEPMRVVGGLTNLVHRRLPEELKAKFAEDFRLIDLNLTQLYNLMEDISSFSKIKREEVNLEPVALDNLLHNACILLKDFIEKNHAVVDGRQLPKLVTNSSLLLIILKNLIENGIKYNTSKTPIITVQYRKAAPYHCISVADNGIGIEASYIPQIFDMFVRLHERGRSGSGIGLAIVKTAVEKLDGRIEVESTVGKGTQFHLYLPDCTLLSARAEGCPEAVSNASEVSLG